ncbi:MAG: hypothetical protein AB1705_01545 [Verrucomicrobiota bacterium]
MITAYNRFLLIAIASVFIGALTLSAAPEDRKAKVQGDRKAVETAAAGKWIYNDLAKGFAEAKLTGKPLLVVLRCIP